MYLSDTTHRRTELVGIFSEIIQGRGGSRIFQKGAKKGGPCIWGGSVLTMGQAIRTI